MRLLFKTKWLRLRALFAGVVLVLLAVELFGQRSWLLGAIQILFIAGIIVTSILDLRELRRRRFNR
jgi:fructose-specific phosphotransferase system IIC component